MYDTNYVLVVKTLSAAISYLLDDFPEVRLLSLSAFTSFINIRGAPDFHRSCFTQRYGCIYTGIKLS
jgi:hypothetical protein